MVVASAVGAPHARQEAQRQPIEPQRVQRRPHGRPDEHHITAPFRARETPKSPGLHRGNPVMRIMLNRRVSPAAHWKQYHAAPAPLHRFDDRERDRTATCDQRERGVLCGTWR